MVVRVVRLLGEPMSHGYAYGYIYDLQAIFYIHWPCNFF